MTTIFKPGDLHVPWFLPYCQLCSQPVERWCVLDVTSPYYIEVEGQCCDKYQGIKISTEELMRILRSNDKLFLVTRKGHYQGIGELRRPGLPKWKPRPKTRMLVLPRKHG